MSKPYLVVFLFIALFGCKKDAPIKKTENPTVPDTIQQTAVRADTLAIIKSFTLNNVNVPFDKRTATFYFPASSAEPSQAYTLNFNSTISTIAFNGIAVPNNKSFTTISRINHQTEIRIIDKNKKTWKFKMVTTGLPVVNLIPNKIISSTILGVKFDLIDPDYKLHKSKWNENGYATLNVRGATSRQYPKKSLAFKITDAAYEDVDISILGLREDNSWILDAMYIDQARMRNRVCTDIWNSFNNVPYFEKEPEALNGTRGYLVEAFIDNEYCGVFCLTEKLDRKQLKAKKKTGLVFKADNWDKTVSFEDIMAYNNNSATWGGWAFDYPEIGDDPVPDWKPLNDLVDFVAHSDDTAFKNEIDSKVDLNNIIDYILLINAFAAGDNTAKNVFFSTYDYPKSKFFFSAWDLDATLGRDWSGKIYQNGQFGFMGPNNKLFYRLLTSAPNDFRVRLKARWNQLKNAQLSKAAINERLTHYAQQLILTHAGDRERARWGNVTQDFESEARYMAAWYSQHYEALDKFITSLPSYNPVP